MLQREVEHDFGTVHDDPQIQSGCHHFPCQKKIVVLFYGSNSLKSVVHPFKPANTSTVEFQRLHVQGTFMVRAVTRRTAPIHEDWAILSIALLPQQEEYFANTRDIAFEFLVQHKRVRIRNIQLSHLGQTLVCFKDIYN
jgi:hypothetical protein